MVDRGSWIGSSAGLLLRQPSRTYAPAPMTATAATVSRMISPVRRLRLERVAAAPERLGDWAETCFTLRCSRWFPVHARIAPDGTVAHVACYSSCVWTPISMGGEGSVSNCHPSPRNVRHFQ